MIGVLQLAGGELKINAENGLEFSTITREMLWRGPVQLSRGAWVVTSEGNVRSYFDRVLKKKMIDGKKDYQVRPRLRSSVITAPVKITLGREVKVTAPHLVWLAEKRMLRSAGLGITIQDRGVSWRSTGSKSVLLISESGEMIRQGAWLKNSQ